MSYVYLTYLLFFIAFSSRLLAVRLFTAPGHHITGRANLYSYFLHFGALFKVSLCDFGIVPVSDLLPC